MDKKKLILTMFQMKFLICVDQMSPIGLRFDLSYICFKNHQNSEIIETMTIEELLLSVRIESPGQFLRSNDGLLDLFP